VSCRGTSTDGFLCKAGDGSAALPRLPSSSPIGATLPSTEPAAGVRHYFYQSNPTSSIPVAIQRPLEIGAASSSEDARITATN
jgi:hypothetical protein